jgi:hypothetical protein
MNNILHFELEAVSIKNTLLSFLSSHLFVAGWALVKIKPSAKLESDLLIVSTLAGQAFGDNFGYHTLAADSSNDTLSLHTEGISNEGGIIPYFALGCIQPSVSGGETRLFDGRKAATLIDANPELADVIIEYSALANPQARVRYPLVVTDKERVVRYRSKVETNLMIHSGKLSEDEIYQKVDKVIKDCLVISHRWEAGDLLFVNNLITLHDRLPFTGHRRMLRVRFNDTLNARIRY